jgi:hypothetical protein
MKRPEIITVPSKTIPGLCAPSNKLFLLEEIFRECVDRNVGFNRDMIEGVIRDLAARDMLRPVQMRSGMSELANYTSNKITRIVNLLRPAFLLMHDVQGDLIAEAVHYDPPPPPPPPPSLFSVEEVHRVLVFSVRTASTYSLVELTRVLKNYLEGKAGSRHCELLESKQVSPKWIDLKVVYNVSLSEAYEWLRKVEWIDKIITKTVPLFGTLIAGMSDDE